MRFRRKSLSQQMRHRIACERAQSWISEDGQLEFSNNRFVIGMCGNMLLAYKLMWLSREPLTMITYRTLYVICSCDHPWDPALFTCEQAPLTKLDDNRWEVYHEYFFSRWCVIC